MLSKELNLDIEDQKSFLNSLSESKTSLKNPKSMLKVVADKVVEKKRREEIELLNSNAHLVEEVPCVKDEQKMVVLPKLQSMRCLKKGVRWDVRKARRNRNLLVVKAMLVGPSPVKWLAASQEKKEQTMDDELKNFVMALEENSKNGEETGKGKGVRKNAVKAKKVNGKKPVVPKVAKKAITTLKKTILNGKKMTKKKGAVTSRAGSSVPFMTLPKSNSFSHGSSIMSLNREDGAKTIDADYNSRLSSSISSKVTAYDSQVADRIGLIRAQLTKATQRAQAESAARKQARQHQAALRKQAAMRQRSVKGILGAAKSQILGDAQTSNAIGQKQSGNIENGITSVAKVDAGLIPFPEEFKTASTK